MTGGASFTLTKSQPSDISQTTVGILLAWMGAEKAGSMTVEKLSATRAVYKNLIGLQDIKDESDPKADRYFQIPQKGTDKIEMQKIVLTSEVLKQTLPKKKTPVQDFAKRYATDDEYKVLVVDHLKKIIHDSVTTMSLNPVFGSLWRAICNDRNNDARDGLINDLGQQVDRISDPSEKARMKTWLEESYDYTAEVIEAVQSVPADERYPCVFLDPTLTFDRTTSGADEAEDEDAGRPITAFKRDELLEIGRSCDYKILRRLGRVLTRLNYVTSSADLPEHIAKDESVARIPMALATQKYGRRFWRILLHIVVPGTMLSSRPGALLAALSVRIGVKPLMEPAYEELHKWRGMWNDIKIPENWNVSCLSLLLDADRIFRSEKKKTKDSIKDLTLDYQTASQTDSSDRRVLNDADRKLFDRLISYKLLERNLTTTLTAKIGWTPENNTMSMGPVVTCKSCNYPRSVTIMSRNNVCGICQLPHDFKSEEDRDAYINVRVSKEDGETADIAWVECNVQTCRAQYVVYHPEALKVRPKCYYCRMGGKLGSAPTVECSKCLSKVIWPEEYRPADLSEFICVGCSNGVKTICYSTRRSPLSTLRVYSRGHPPPFNLQAFPLYLSTQLSTRPLRVRYLMRTPSLG